MKQKLQFINKRFRIMLVGDPHEKTLTSDGSVQKKVKDYLTLQYAAVKELKPNLVILMGDNASSDTPAGLREILLRITAPYYEAGIPFAFILGNHDLETKISDLDTQYNIYRSLPGIFFPEEYSQDGDYDLPVFSGDGKDKKLILWFIYNGAHPDKKYHSHYSAVTEEQIRHYISRAESYRVDGRPVPAIAFQHVPVSEEYELLDKKAYYHMLFNSVSGLDGHFGQYYDLKKTTEGYMGEAPCTADYNTGQFAAWQRTGDVFAAFFGHDHMNDLFGDVNGIKLGQCKTSSFRVYGDGMMQGVRIIDLNEDNVKDFSTKMVYYRDLVGNDCRSIQGREKILRDRQSVKLDVICAASKIILPVLIPAAAVGFIKKKR